MNDRTDWEKKLDDHSDVGVSELAALRAVAKAARAYLKDTHFAQWADLNDAIKELDKEQ